MKTCVKASFGRRRQEAGVRVTLWGIGDPGNQSPTLLSEVDRNGRLDDFRKWFSAAKGSALYLASAKSPDEASSPLDNEAVRATGRGHAEQWLALATPDEFADLLAQRPTIPSTLDAELLRQAQAAHGNLRGHD